MKGKLNREGGGGEGGAVGRQQALYIVVSVGRYCIDRKDTIFIPSNAERGEGGNEPEGEVEKKEMLILVCVRNCEMAQPAMHHH